MFDDDLDFGLALGLFAGFAVATLMWLIVFTTGAIDNSDTWTMSDIEGELRERYGLPDAQVEQDREQLRQLLDALDD